jgi:NADH-quinone oxidoreductase subunit J
VLDEIVFGATFVVALGSSIAMLFAPNAVHVALFLVASQVALALAFLLQGAFFIAAIQIILYAGAIMVLFLVTAAAGEGALNSINRDPGNVMAIARALFGDYLLPFEVTSVLLVVAIVGVMVMARTIGAAGTGMPAGKEEAEEVAA